MDMTRDEAIERVVKGLTRYTVNQGAELAQIIGPEIAAELTLQQIDQDQQALEALGVTEEDVHRVAQALEARKETADA